MIKLNNQQTRDLFEIIKMYSEHEKQHWDEEGKPINHIHHSLRRLSDIFNKSN